MRPLKRTAALLLAASIITVLSGKAASANSGTLTDRNVSANNGFVFAVAPHFLVQWPAEHSSVIPNPAKISNATLAVATKLRTIGANDGRAKGAPEPGTIAIFGTGLLWVMMLARRFAA